MKQKAVFLDRDGTLIKEKHYLKNSCEIEIIKGVVEGLHMLQDLDFKLIIITNQSGIKRGYFTEKDVEKVHLGLRSLLLKHGIEIDGIYYSSDLPEEVSSTRKPRTGLIERAERELDIQLDGSYVLGDKRIDIEMGKRKRLKTILVLTGYGMEHKGKVKPDYVAENVYDAAQWIKSMEDEGINKS
ncbi:MAG: HAD family hydrolase [Candidatus Cloacimonadota bacterium]|nr:MAG: HAD family hydrolase [Candidatus Cloacimonadota bacterium]